MIFEPCNLKETLENTIENQENWISESMENQYKITQINDFQTLITTAFQASPNARNINKYDGF